MINKGQSKHAYFLQLNCENVGNLDAYFMFANNKARIYVSRANRDFHLYNVELLCTKWAYITLQIL